MRAAILKHETIHNLAPMFCAELLTTPTPAKCNSKYVTQTQCTTNRAFLKLLLKIKITHSFAATNFATLLNARILLALIFIGKEVLDGKSNPSNTKAMAILSWLTYICAAYYFLRVKSSNYLFLILDISYGPKYCSITTSHNLQCIYPYIISLRQRNTSTFSRGETLVETSSLFVQQLSLKLCNITSSSQNSQ